MEQLIGLTLLTMILIFCALRLCDGNYSDRMERLLRRYRGEYLPQREVDGVLK